MHRAITHSPRFWDTAIAVLLIGGAGSGVLAYQWMTMHPSAPILLRVLVGSIGLLGGIGALLVAYGSFIEPKLIKVNTKSVHIEGLPAMKIAIIGDPHVGPYKDAHFLRRAVKKINALHADIIVLPGDFIYDSSTSHLAPLAPLKHLQAAHGVFAVLGNHDTGHMLERKNGEFVPYRMPDRSAALTEVFRKMGITMLRNQHVVLEIRQRKVAIAGGDHCWMDSYDTTKTFGNIPADVPTILLSHIPDVILDKKSQRASLIISGHTHGGQIRLPFIGALYAMPDKLGRAYDQGLFNLHKGGILAITHGIGETMARARLFCPPEILLLNVQSK